ncbi:hypothetical protein DFH11DRAFT_41699 [Phellopilus nigrolimitatus]|nr:hypothetical protein DFH11DRAFT_41699 [Phellopilus nigrolimitatus]
MAVSLSDPRPLLGLSSTSSILQDYLKQLATLTTSKQVPSAEIKSYPDVLYMNYYPLGLSLLFITKDGSKSITQADVHSDKLVLDSIDIYNVGPVRETAKGKAKAPSTAQVYRPHPVSSLVLPILAATDASNPRPAEITISVASTGKDIVGVLGEPDRKGGGAGPSSGSIGIWCEWSRDGFMVEFGGIEASGPQAWERGKDAKWKVLTLFRPKDM